MRRSYARNASNAKPHIITASRERVAAVVPFSAQVSVLAGRCARQAQWASQGAGVTDPYDSLGIEPEADTDEIRSAYRRLARQFHPDQFGDASPSDQQAAHHRMQEINQAFAVLTDPTERQRFERQQRLRQKRSTAGGRTPDGPRPGKRAAADEAGHVRFNTRSRNEPSTTPDDGPTSSRAWRAEPRPDDLTIREFSGWGEAHWVFVHAPGGRAGKMNVTTGEVTIEREELRDQVLQLLRHYAIDSW